MIVRNLTRHFYKCEKDSQIEVEIDEEGFVFVRVTEDDETRFLEINNLSFGDEKERRWLLEISWIIAYHNNQLGHIENNQIDSKL